ncbi:MAG: RNA polymerase sigma factor RpoH [Legionellales bacterium]|jgi:RNA polymerase sigma-32 factor|nr:RNA polymerase sigma factor RpoH [Legionellales bacterium]|tara:strand:- start:2293 stop:3141 length:849 start_codon:yes stop_codon:yes gene_type:complete
MIKKLPNIQCALPVGSIDCYIHSVNQVPILSLDEEQNLARLLQNEGDIDAARQLIMSHLRFVVKIARGYNGYGLQQADLIQEGNIGLMKAVKRFNPDVGVRLVSFAVHWIRAEIHEFILKNWRVVKIATTKAQRKLFFNLRSSKKRLGWLNQKEINEVAKDLGVKPADVIEMEKRMSNYDAAFETDLDDDSITYQPSQYLQNDDCSPEELLENEQNVSNEHENLQSALSLLDDRSKDIVSKRWLNEKKATLHDLAAIHNISAERVRQIESSAIKKLRNSINK